jgi:DNA-directed RNA polymerase subunit L
MSFNNGGGSSADDRNVFLPTTDVRWTYKPRNHVDKKGRKCIVGEFTINDEDHTLGQLIRLAYDGADARILGCEYVIPHPLEAVMRVRCQTTGGLTPPAAIDAALKRTLDDIARIRRQVVDAVKPAAGQIVASAIAARD